MAFAGMSHLAIGVAAIVAWLLGAVYYTLLGRAWMTASGVTPGQRRIAPFIISFVAEIVMAYLLAGLIGHLGPGQVTLKNGVISAAFVWVGFVATTTTVMYAYQGRPFALTAIDAGHWLLVLLAMGAVIGGFGV